MKIKTITYGFKKNMGNYESKHVEVTAEIHYDENPDQAFIALEYWVHSQLRKELDNVTLESEEDIMF